MKTVHCYRAIEGSKFDTDIKDSVKAGENWNKVYDRVGELLGEKIDRMGQSSRALRIPQEDLTKPENKKLFKQDGMLKSNTKAAKELHNKYIEIIKEAGLEGWMDLNDLSFAYGTMRSRGQNLERFLDSDYRMYFKADYDMLNRWGNDKPMLETITEIEYEETYLQSLKDKKEMEESQ